MRQKTDLRNRRVQLKKLDGKKSIKCIKSKKLYREHFDDVKNALY